MDETTTTVPVDTDGVQDQSTQPDQTTAPVAEAPQTEVSNPEPSTEQTADDNLDWLQSKGIDPQSPEAITKLAEMYKNAERQMTKVSQEASELKKSLNPEPQTGPVDDGMGEFIADYKRDKMISTFKDTHEDWKEQEPVMAKLLTEQVNTSQGLLTRSQLVNAGILSLEDVYTMAKGSSPDTESIKADAKNEVLQQLANTQRAGGAQSSATNSNPKAPNTDTAMDALRKGLEG